MTIRDWISQATRELESLEIASAQLDAEIILSHTIGHPRTWLHAHTSDKIDMRHLEIANARLDLRRDFVPIAYIIGHKEFYGRRFRVTPETLIPRPESEQIIELLTEVMPATASLMIGSPKRLVDVGTGSGCLGITAKLEHPELDVTLLDTSKPALAVAQKNALLHDVEVTTLHSNLLDNYPFNPDIVLANLPYVDPTWDRSPETAHEPDEALFANEHGVGLIRTLCEQLRSRMTAQTYAIFEADPRQWEEIEQIAKENGLSVHTRRQFAVLFTKD